MILKNDQSLTTITVEELRADAEKKTAILRELAAAFQPEPDTPPLTTADMRLASGTPLLYLEKGAALLEAVPQLNGTSPNAASIMRLGIEAELAYGKVLAQSKELTRQIRMAMLRPKLRAVKMARATCAVAEGFAQTDEGDAIKLHVEDMKQSRRRPARKPATKNTGDETTTK